MGQLLPIFTPSASIFRYLFNRCVLGVFGGHSGVYGAGGQKGGSGVGLGQGSGVKPKK